jgi:hypothetical protein
MKKLEVICDAIAQYHHYGDPESEAYELRNPGLLQGEMKNPRTQSGKRIFSCHRAGYAALLDVVQKYCAAHKEAKVQVLLEQFGIKMKMQQENAVDFMARCANSNALKLETSLSWFLDD